MILCVKGNGLEVLNKVLHVRLKMFTREAFGISNVHFVVVVRYFVDGILGKYFSCTLIILVDILGRLSFSK